MQDFELGVGRRARQIGQRFDDPFLAFFGVKCEAVDVMSLGETRIHRDRRAYDLRFGNVVVAFHFFDLRKRAYAQRGHGAETQRFGIDRHVHRAFLVGLHHHGAFVAKMMTDESDFRVLPDLSDERRPGGDIGHCAYR